MASDTFGTFPAFDTSLMLVHSDTLELPLALIGGLGVACNVTALLAEVTEAWPQVE